MMFFFLLPLSQYKTAYSKNATFEVINLTQATESSESDHDLTCHLPGLCCLENLICDINTGTPQITRHRFQAPSAALIF